MLIIYVSVMFYFYVFIIEFTDRRHIQFNSFFVTLISIQAHVTVVLYDLGTINVAQQ